MKSSADLLFDYLKDILYAPDRAELDLGALPPDFQRLGQGMQFLADCVRESRTFTRAMAKGDLSLAPPKVDNVLAAPMKELQGTLRHLTWQTQQVAKGDYSQRVDFMGEFSQAFNTMIQQLQDRTEELIRKKEAVEMFNQELTKSLDLVLALTNHTKNMIFVFSEESGQQIFANQPARWFTGAAPEKADGLTAQLAVHGCGELQASDVWDVESSDENGAVFYSVESFSIVWKDESAVVHIVANDTERKKRENLHFQLAYVDPLTGLKNRRFAMDQMARWTAEGTPFVFSFVDVDYLKYCNDTFGHEMGDQYLTDVAHALQALGGILCRAGGDEFFLLQEHTTPEKQDARLSALRQLLRTKEDVPYPCSFSFASTLVPEVPEAPLEAYIRATDENMYQFKLTYKTPLSDRTYRDDRVGG